ncbi:hypothetical protein GCM10009745_77350 [Kribbella yunnanensis]|uniref:Uncharacterized protein n=1 Tax=Kribbella yunnanensis TaxID=190194 RepID=A0ABN2J3G4_9ACTN
MGVEVGRGLEVVGNGGEGEFAEAVLEGCVAAGQKGDADVNHRLGGVAGADHGIVQLHEAGLEAGDRAADQVGRGRVKGEREATAVERVGEGL